MEEVPMDDVVSRQKVLATILEWITKDEINRPDAIKLLGDRIRNIPSENIDQE